MPHQSFWIRWWPWATKLGPQQLRADAVAGLLGMVLSLPQGIAFAALAGLPIEYGVYTSVVPTIVAALAGSSWHVTSGPTNAISLAILTMLSPMAAAGSPDYIQLVLAATLMVGVMQWLIGAFRLDRVQKLFWHWIPPWQNFPTMRLIDRGERQYQMVLLWPQYFWQRS